MAQSWAQAARLLRCTGFGASGREVDAVVPLSRTAFVAGLFATAPDPGVARTPVPQQPPLPALGSTATADQRQQRRRLAAAQGQELLGWWLNRMVAVQHPFRERITLAWHGIFATSLDKVGVAPYMLRQNATLRARATGDFRTLALSMLTDAALIVWLDNQRNTKASPNENLAREFMELFALGHGNGYTEDDVREGARALTGWSVDPVTGLASPRPAQHDDGIKTVLGVTGPLDHVGYLDAVLAQPASGPFVLGRLWNQLVSDDALPDTTRSDAAAAYGAGRDLAAALTVLLTGPGFDRAAGTRVLSPVEWAVGLARAVGAAPNAATAGVLTAAVTALGQVPFHPPSVGGWPAGQAWLTASSIDARWSHGAAIIALGDIDAVGAAAPSSRLDTVAHLLGVASWSDRSAAALRAFSAPADLVAAAAMTPEYVTV